jgi:hypothetical protein
MIFLSKATVSKTAAANTAVGNFTAVDASGKSITAHWLLPDPDAMGCFYVSGNVLVTSRANLAAGIYSVRVIASSQTVGDYWKGKAVFNVTVS